MLQNRELSRAAYEQAAVDSQNKQAGEAAAKKHLVHVAAAAKKAVAYKEGAQRTASLSARGPWYTGQQALAI